MGKYTSKYTGQQIDDKLDEVVEVVGNPTIPSGTTPTSLSNLKIDSNYYTIPAAPMGTMYAANDLAIGTNSKAGTQGANNYCTACGVAAIAQGQGCIAIGYDAMTTGNAAIIIGNGTRTTSGASIAIGYNAAAADNGIAIGRMAKDYTKDSIAIGKDAQAGDAGGLYLKAISLGSYAKCLNTNSIAIGTYSQTYVPQWVSFDGIGADYIRTISLYDTTKIFFRNEIIDSTKTTQAAYTNGKTLQNYLDEKITKLADGSFTSYTAKSIATLISDGYNYVRLTGYS